MIIKVESYKIFSEIYCPIMPAPLELFFGDGCRSAKLFCLFIFSGTIGIRVIIFKGEDIGNMLPICISNALLNMCSERQNDVISTAMRRHDVATTSI